jgi:hypothetical protein
MTFSGVRPHAAGIKFEALKWAEGLSSGSELAMKLAMKKIEEVGRPFELRSESRRV